MLKVRLKRAVSIAGHDFKAGIHEIPAKVEKHWYFQSLIKSGRAEILTEKKNAGLSTKVAPPTEDTGKRPPVSSVPVADDEIEEVEETVDDVSDFMDKAEGEEESNDLDDLDSEPPASDDDGEDEAPKAKSKVTSKKKTKKVKAKKKK